MSNNQATTIEVVQQQPPAMPKMALEKIEQGELKRVLVSEIVPDPNQPRKTFYKLSMEELEKAVAAAGQVLESLLLRKTGDNKYMIIFGERRWRVAKKLGLKDVPAMIVVATDQQALILQIVENMQRENLPPLEQAAGFKRMAVECHLNAQEIALQVGKTEYFVRQQIKLTALIPQWQNILNKQGIPMGIALQIAVLPEATQKELYSNHVRKEDATADRPIIQINQHTLSQYKGLLSEASFDTKDATIDPKMGACTTCPFNTACHSLFPEEQEKPRCNNIACFNNKTAIHRSREFNKAKEDPTILLVYDAYSTPEQVKTLKAEGLEILKLGYADDCKELIEPKEPDWTAHAELCKRNKLSGKTTKDRYTTLLKDFQTSRNTFDKHITSGKYKKAFVVYDSYGRNTGKYLYVELNPKKPTAKNVKTVIANGNATLQDIESEIKRMQDREIRSVELDGIKIQEKIVQGLKDNKMFQELPKTTNRIDNTLIRYWLLESIGYARKSIVEKIVKQPGSGSLPQYLQWLDSLSNQQVSFLIRQIILEKCSSNLPNSKGGFLLRKMAESLNFVPVGTVEKEQNEKAKKRKNAVQARINELNKLKKQYTGSSKTTSSKRQATPKKRAKAKAA